MIVGTPSHARLRLPLEHQESFVERMDELAEADGKWRIEDRLKLDFDTHHPQGLVKIEDHYYLSTVQMPAWFKPGKGYLIKFDEKGRQLAKISLGDSRRYHPGGIDFDGESIWVSVAEYRPNSSTKVYRVDEKSMEAELAFTVDDHVGAITRDPESGELWGATWDSERILRWNEDGELQESRPNSERSINYQDWKFAGDDYILSSGVRSRNGGLDLVDSENKEILSKVPLALRSPDGKPMTQNPMTFRYSDEGLKLYVIPDDDSSELFVLSPDRSNKGQVIPNHSL